MPIIVGRGQRAGTTASGSRTSSSTDLPPYQPLSCALDSEAQQALSALANARDTRRYEDHIKNSMKVLGKTTAAVNDRLVERRAELDVLARRRIEKGTEKSRREEELQKWVPVIVRDIGDLDVQFERALRDLVDRQAELEDERKSAAAMAAYFQDLPSRNQSFRRRGTDGSDNDGEEEPELPPPDRDPLSVLEERRAMKRAEYNAMTPYQRYALNNEYAAFKKLWHDAKFGDEDVPLPDPSKWFDRDGQPVLGKSSRGHRKGNGIAHGEEDDDEEEEDDDLVVEGENRSYICPLSQQQITEPYSNDKCSHVFQKQSITEWLSEPGHRGRPTQCPTPGCDKAFTIKDFRYDELIMRKIQRANKRREQEEAEQDDQEEPEEIAEDEDEDIRPKRRAGTTIKRENKRMVVDDMDEH